jgi:hypothetical protein
VVSYSGSFGDWNSCLHGYLARRQMSTCQLLARIRLALVYRSPTLTSVYYQGPSNTSISPATSALQQFKSDGTSTFETQIQ